MPSQGIVPMRAVQAGTKLGAMTTAELRHHLQALSAERAAAALAGLHRNDPYVHDLEDEIAATHYAYLKGAITEIATLRAQLGGPQVG